MYRLPVIVGFGGYNAAGRSSFHHGFRRMVIESMDPQARQETLAGLAVMMKLVKAEGGRYLAEDGTPLSPEDIERRYAERIFASTWCDASNRSTSTRMQSTGTRSSSCPLPKARR